MKSLLAILLLVSLPVMAESFTPAENRILKTVMAKIAPIEEATTVYCSFAEPPVLYPNRNMPIVYCGVEYEDPNGWLTTYRTKWLRMSGLASLLLNRGHCEEVDGWTRPQPRPLRCQLHHLRCGDNGCSADLLKH